MIVKLYLFYFGIVSFGHQFRMNLKGKTISVLLQIKYASVFQNYYSNLNNDFDLQLGESTALYVEIF